ncbi:MBOAT family O-acyltransferase [Massilioclostridium coli]|uniref:MBOAT family O-acyltransferase n=1 Tax=Massilioclostridium coli TaxID=1870991 RepID=UPI00085C6089|nr:MBOAT family O-acyltransferase [Massilioclostridium coli]
MVFSSIFFLFCFLPIVLIVYFIVPKRWKNLVLLLFSLFFYAWGEPVYVILMLLSILFNYVMGLDIAQRNAAHRPKKAKASLIFTVVVNLFLLGFFKYAGFLIGTINDLFVVNLPYKELALPIGISFYTFQTLSYIFDVYWKKVEVQRNFIHFSLYVTMFPQLIAGPIVKYTDISVQLENRHVTLTKLGLGAEFFIKGLAKKVLLANNLGQVYTYVQGLEPGSTSILTTWLGIIAYTFQIYFDFSGYSDMAIGLGEMFGFQFMKNFHYPYVSKSITEFWRRWHISLSSWFRDYVYIPLGGNRVSVPRHICNLLIVWGLTGLWHGASWNFVVWGLYYGVLLILEKYVFVELIQRMPTWLNWLCTILLVMIGWVFFSNTSMADAWSYLQNMFDFFHHALWDSTGLYLLQSNFILMAIAALVCGPGIYRVFKHWMQKRPWLAVVINVVLCLACVAYLVYDTYNPFLYFRF